MIKVSMLELYVGDHFDYLRFYDRIVDNPNWSIISAAKEPYHRELLGYTTKGAPKDHPDYLYARDKNRLVLNLVDSNNVNYIPKEVINVAVNYGIYSLKEGKSVFIHCNQGKSRSMCIAFFILKDFTHELDGLTCENAIDYCKRITHNKFFPNDGMLNFIQQNYNEKFYART